MNPDVVSEGGVVGLIEKQRGIFVQFETHRVDRASLSGALKFAACSGGRGVGTNAVGLDGRLARQGDKTSSSDGFVFDNVLAKFG
jgi:hypothetical protein